MPRLSFSIRDVFWLTLVVAMGVGWLIHARQSSAKIAEAKEEAWSGQREFRRMIRSLDEAKVRWWPGNGKYWFAVSPSSRVMRDPLLPDDSGIPIESETADPFP